MATKALAHCSVAAPQNLLVSSLEELVHPLQAQLLPHSQQRQQVQHLREGFLVALLQRLQALAGVFSVRNQLHQERLRLQLEELEDCSATLEVPRPKALRQPQ